MECLQSCIRWLIKNTLRERMSHVDKISSASRHLSGVSSLLRLHCREAKSQPRRPAPAIRRYGKSVVRSASRNSAKRPVLGLLLRKSSGRPTVSGAGVDRSFDLSGGFWRPKELKTPLLAAPTLRGKQGPASLKQATAKYFSDCGVQDGLLRRIVGSAVFFCTVEDKCSSAYTCDTWLLSYGARHAYMV